MNRTPNPGRWLSQPPRLMRPEIFCQRDTFTVKGSKVDSAVLDLLANRARAALLQWLRPPLLAAHRRRRSSRRRRPQGPSHSLLCILSPHKQARRRVPQVVLVGEGPHLWAGGAWEHHSFQMRPQF